MRLRKVSNRMRITKLISIAVIALFLGVGCSLGGQPAEPTVQLPSPAVQAPTATQPADQSPDSPQAEAPADHEAVEAETAPAEHTAVEHDAVPAPEHEAVEHEGVEHEAVEPISDTETLNPVSPGGEYYLAVSYALEAEAPAELGTDYKRITVVATLGNENGPAVEVSPASLALVDQTGQRFAPLPETDMEPALIGTQLAEGQSIYGFVSFDIPVNTREAILEWCLAEPHPCEQPLQSPLP